MKKLLFLLFIPFCFSCDDADIIEVPLEAMIQAEQAAAFECINSQADNAPPLADAKKWIVGKWQLKSVIAMIQNPEIPNYQVEFMEDGGVKVYKVGELVFSDAYSIVESSVDQYTYLSVITDSFQINDDPFSQFNEDNIVRGALRICEKELMIDQGIAFDAPGYLFRKIEE